MGSNTPNTIVIVDDDVDLNEILRYSLEARGFKVFEATNCNEALSFLMDENNHKEIALVILDRLLPDCDGLEILKKVVAKYDHTFPVIILSVLTAESEQLLGLKLGSLDYIPKPFSLPVLVEKAVSVVEHYRSKAIRID